jgi:2-polyprenyl-3-methyl-5-hydroxy-6-metoxy-1,4-benzoquinol methylase
MKTRAAPDLTDWPADDLESVPLCEVCGSADRTLLLDGLIDRIFHAAPGRWTLWRCTGCAAATLDPRPTAASIGRAYSAYYTHEGEAAKNFLVPGDRPDLWFKRAMHLSHYNRVYGHRLPGALPLGWALLGASQWRSARAGQFIRHLPGPPDDKAQLLDVGCGDGAFLRVARALGYQARGIEFDPAAAALAQRHGFEVFVGGVDDAAVAAGSIEQITLSHVIEHLHHPVNALRLLHDWLAPGGRIWLQTPNIASAGAQRYGGAWRGLEPPRHLVMFNPGALRLALESAGFERIELLPPQLDAQFFIGQSKAIADGCDPYRLGRDERRAARREGTAWDRAALRDPGRAESITMVGYRAA